MKLGRDIASKARGRSVNNIIAHSMGGLDARYLISRPAPGVDVKSLVTIATLTAEVRLPTT